MSLIVHVTVHVTYCYLIISKKETMITTVSKSTDAHAEQYDKSSRLFNETYDLWYFPGY